MRIEYIREMKRSYMTVTGEGVGESYETGMLAKNQISGLLKMKIKIHGWSTCILLGYYFPPAW